MLRSQSPSYTLRSNDLYIRVYDVLCGIVAMNDLLALSPTGPGHLLPQALIILRCYLDLSPEPDPVAKKACQDFQLLFMTMHLRLQPLPPANALYHYAARSAGDAMTPARLRLDERNRSVCSGGRLVRVQFFWIGVCCNAASVCVRLEDKMLCMYLSTEELPDLETRLLIGNQVNCREGTGEPKVMIWRAQFHKVGRETVLAPTLGTPY